MIPEKIDASLPQDGQSGRERGARSDVQLKVAKARPPVESDACAKWAPPDGLKGLLCYGNALLEEADKPVVFVVDRLIEEDDLVLISGREKLSLKTMLALDLAVARVLGTTWAGFRCAGGRPGAVLYVSTETSKRAIGRRLRGLCNGRGVSVESVAPFIAVYDMPVSLIPRSTRSRASETAKHKGRLIALRDYDKEKRESIIESIDAIGESDAAQLGRNLSVLASVEEARRGTWSLIVIDTLRGCLEGDDNDSNDARAFMQAARELARAAGCPVVAIHHSNKSGDASDSRSSRGSVELTAAPDVLITIDAGGNYPTAHFTLRNHAAPPPTGYELVVEKGDQLRVVAREPAAIKGKDGNTEDDVLSVLRLDVAFTTSRVRQLVAEKNGGKPGAKANAGSVLRCLEALAARGAASLGRAEGKNGVTFPGWLLGPGGGTVPTARQEKRGRDFSLEGGVE